MQKYFEIYNFPIIHIFHESFEDPLYKAEVHNVFKGFALSAISKVA